MELDRSQFQSLTCSEQLKEELIKHISDLAAVLGENGVGVYLYGSQAHQCANSHTSDIDLIVVTRERCPESSHSALLQCYQAIGTPVDAVFTTQEQLQVDVLPTPVNFLIKPISGYQLIQNSKGRNDFLLQRQDAYESGVALGGPSFQQLTHPVPWSLLEKSLDDLFPYIVPCFKNPILMLCRIAYAHTFKKLCSKHTAGRWALDQFGSEWEPVIKATLDQYAGNDKAGSIEKASITTFERICIGYINELKQKALLR
jgi:streptomycin 3"-adenylyltransferase